MPFTIESNTIRRKPTFTRQPTVDISKETSNTIDEMKNTINSLLQCITELSNRLDALECITTLNSELYSNQLDKVTDKANILLSTIEHMKPPPITEPKSEPKIEPKIESKSEPKPKPKIKNKTIIYPKWKN